MDIRQLVLNKTKKNVEGSISWGQLEGEMCFTKSRNFKDVFMVGGTNLSSSPRAPPGLPHHTTSVEFADFVDLYLRQFSTTNRVQTWHLY